MSVVMVFFVGLSVLALAYVYVGYPLLLLLIVRLRGARPVRRRAITPSVSLVISAYNEAAVIRRKVENALALDYPRDRLEVVVVSDASTDRTDEIVAEYAARGVVLVRQPVRQGKTAGLDRAVPLSRGEVVVFSDANAMYRRDALRMLVRNFADPEVGCVTGEARYTAGRRSTADLGERAYWQYEIQIKKLETALGSMVGGDGAIYAIRRELWRDLPPTAINDFLNPLQIVAAGWRAVYDADAVCHEDTAGAVWAEYRRRVRIVSRSWRAVFQARAVLNPFRVGAFAWCVVSHKLLRWLAGWLALPGVIGISVLALSAIERAPLAIAAVSAAVAGAVVATRRGRRLAAMLGYFATINVASMAGVVKGCVGHVSGIWATARHGERPGGAAAPGPMAHLGVIPATAVAASVAALVTLTSASSPRSAVLVFWTAAGLLGYVYVVYPLLLLLLGRVAARPVSRRPVQPTVCLFITAHNEGAVIGSKLRNALALEYPADRLEIVVASDGSDDDTTATVRRFAPRVQLLDFPTRRGKAAVIADGVARVDADLVVFSDANTFLEPGALAALVRPFGDPQVGAVSGDVTLVGDRAALARSEDLYYRYERWIQLAESDIGSMMGADGALYAIRRELFVAPRGDTILDDFAIPSAVIRAGRRVVFEPDARAREQGSDTAREEFARKVRVVAGAMQFMCRRENALPLRPAQILFSFVSHKALRWFSPAFAACTGIASLQLAGTADGYAAAAAAHLALLGGAAAGCVSPLRRVGAISVAHYFCLVQAAAAVGIVRGLAGRQSVRWQRFPRAPIAPPVETIVHHGAD